MSRLSDAATWCDRQRLFGSRDRVFARILALEPDHARARAGLKFSRDAGGRWVRRTPYTAPPDWNRGLVAQADEKIAAALAGYRDAVTASVAGDDVPLARRELALDALVDLLPDDRVVRELRGDVLDGGTWKMQESVDGARRRAELRAEAVAARRAFSARRPADGTGGWTSGLVASGIRLYSTLHATVVEDVLRDTVVADAVARAALVTPPDAGAPVRVLYVLDDREQALAFIARDAKNPAQAVAEARLVSGFWLDGESYVAYHADPVWRARACPRVAVDGELRRAFPRAVGGFVVEGVGQRLGYLALDAHGPPFVTIEGTDRPGADEDESEPLPKNPREWMPRAARVLQADGGRRLAVVLSARLNAMTPANVLAAYALAAYLLEARPDTLKPLVDALVESADAAKVVEDVLGGDLASLAVRVRRYALEND
ncbi:MAG: hypothetical protein JNM10_13985 [Planctomycetia bacterium]|nr:hypothetical protein [Planctomycetia bacterium]